jgi:hypothetical protein
MMKQMTSGQPMPGMKMSGEPTPVTVEDRRQATEFIVRMLADPTVERRIHSDPALQKLWSDPDVQRRLAELRREQAAASAGKRDSVKAPMPSMPSMRPDSSPSHRHP